MAVKGTSRRVTDSVDEIKNWIEAEPEWTKQNVSMDDMSSTLERSL
jgi:hypothetical protein